MKIAVKDIEGYLRNPAEKTRAVLLYGPDQGLASERARDVLGRLVDDADDPFQVVRIDGKLLDQDPGRLVDEALSFSMLGGRRAVHVKMAGNQSVSAMEQLLQSDVTGDFVVVEAGELTPKSSLRKCFEKAANAAAVACYGDEGGGLIRVIQTTLQAGGLTADRDAMEYLSRCLGGDRRVVRNEIEKLMLFAGSAENDDGRGPITLQEAMACIGDNTEAAVDKIIKSVFAGDYPALDRAIESSFTEGISPVPVLRAVARYLQRLLAARALMDEGKSASAAVSGLRPPVFFKDRDHMVSHAARWNRGKITKALDIVLKAENDAKTTGLPAEILCHRALMRLTRAA